MAHSMGLPPDGTPVDNGLSQWHSDGTEVTLDSRPPQTGDVCLGVWQKIGECHYKLNHYGIAFDPSTDPNNPLGYANIRQDVYLSKDGKSFTGRFSIRQYNRSGNLLVEITRSAEGKPRQHKQTVGDLLRQG